MSNEYCPRLIEVALPIREISAESVRDKRIDQGNISSLHTWWARRPLAASRAVVFASVVPDPDDPSCPASFRDAVDYHLRAAVPKALQYYRRGGKTIHDPDPYRPYGEIEDTLRGRLLMFIARWSRDYLDFEAGSDTKEPTAPYVLDDRCLVKWETSDPESEQGRQVLRIAQSLIRTASEQHAPIILDPFAGGGAIPLEVSRLGCTPVANDYNPVAHLIQRATIEFPQRYGRPGSSAHSPVGATGDLFDMTTGQVANVLVADLEHWAKEVLEVARQTVGHLYPAGSDGRQVLTYLWARTVRCSNPSCAAEIPLLRSLLLRSDKPKTGFAISLDYSSKTSSFHIARGGEIGSIDGTKKQRGPAICLFCKEPTSEEELRQASLAGEMGERIVGVVVGGKGCREYRAAEEADIKAFEVSAAHELIDIPSEYIVPEMNAPGASAAATGETGIRVHHYGFTRWGDLFNRRQLVVLSEFIKALHQVRSRMEHEVPDPAYRKALALYLGLWISRIATRGNTMCRWFTGREAIQSPFGSQSLPMMWDYPEVNPFSDSPAGAERQLERMVAVLRRECGTDEALIEPRMLLGTAEALPLESSTCACVVTDPPYGYAVDYADLSDFFYVWLKRTVAHDYPEAFRTPQTPKQREATSHRHRHEGSQEAADRFYRNVLTACFSECYRVAAKPQLLSVMFAHQSTDAWSALLSALFDANFCPRATWPLATEMPNAVHGLGKSALESSVTVVCRPRAFAGAESFKIVKKEIQEAVEEAVHRFWSYGFRGADLIVASYGPAVGVFGKYERVERADGTHVGVPELLEFARHAARDAIAGEFHGDNISTLYYVWANLYGAAEQSWDDARLVVQIGGDAESAMDVARNHEIFVITGPKCRLALLSDRADRRGLGFDPNPPLIDALHRAMLLWKSERRSELVGYLGERGLLDEARFWKLAQALFEVLPRGSEDWKLVSALLGERDTLRTEAKRTTVVTKPQVEMDFDKTEAGGE